MTYLDILRMVLSGIVPSLILSLVIYLLYWKHQRKHSLISACMIMYICMLFYVTVYRHGISIEELWLPRPRINMIPLVSTFQLYHYGGWLVFLYNIIGNIVWFLPFGFILPYLKDHYRMYHIFLCSFILSSSIEFVQYVLNCGISDIDDIIFNVLGGCVGYALFCLIPKKYKR